MVPPAHDLPPRLRAAQAYAGLDNPHLAGALGISVETLSRMKNGRTPIDTAVAYKWADITGVPRAFMDLGFGPLEREWTDTDLAVAELQQQFSALRAAVVELAVGNLQDALALRVPGEGGQSEGPAG